MGLSIRFISSALAWWNVSGILLIIIPVDVLQRVRSDNAKEKYDYEINNKFFRTGENLNLS